MSSNLSHEQLVPIFGRLGLDADRAILDTLLNGIGTASIGVCLCDESDRIRYANPAFRLRCFPQVTDTPTDFVDALAAEIEAGRGIQLLTMSLETFIARVKERRRSTIPHVQFAVDFVDGSWWLINDFKLDNGWMLVFAAEISGLKNEEIRLREAHARALEAAQTDFLTGVANRRHGFERTEALLVQAREARSPLCIALLDIDHFKQINDLHGHLAGDRVLVHFARTLADAFPFERAVSRVGGEEFLVVMPGVTASLARQKLQLFLSEPASVPGARDGHVVRYTASAGIAQAYSAEMLTDLLHRADMALYEAKAQGRHRVELFCEPIGGSSPPSTILDPALSSEQVRLLRTVKRA